MSQEINVPYCRAIHGKLFDSYLHQYPNRSKRRYYERINWSNKGKFNLYHT